KETVVRVLLRDTPAAHASLTTDVREDARVTNQDVRTARVGRNVVLEELETRLDDVGRLEGLALVLHGRGDVRQDLVLDQFVDDLRRLVRQDASLRSLERNQGATTEELRRRHDVTVLVSLDDDVRHGRQTPSRNIRLLLQRRLRPRD